MAAAICQRDKQGRNPGMVELNHEKCVLPELLQKISKTRNCPKRFFWMQKIHGIPVDIPSKPAFQAWRPLRAVVSVLLISPPLWFHGSHPMFRGDRACLCTCKYVCKRERERVYIYIYVGCLCVYIYIYTYCIYIYMCV